ncbi:MAG: ISAs1 family transposase [Streptosporangiaceae bacterium]
MAQREVAAKTNEIPELASCLEGLDLAGMVVTLDALHTQRETARLPREDKGAHYLMIVKANQPTLLEQVTDALKGPDADFAGTCWTEEGTGHGRRERRSIRTALADGIDWAGRRPGPAHPPRHRSHHGALGQQGGRLWHRQDQEPARCLRCCAQPRHGSRPQGGIRQHRLRAPLLRTRRPAHPRPLRIYLTHWIPRPDRAPARARAHPERAAGGVRADQGRRGAVPRPSTIGPGRIRAGPDAGATRRDRSGRTRG